MAAAGVPAGQQPVVPIGLGAKLRWGVADALVIAQRSLRRVPRQPELLLGFSIQPVMFVLLFRYVFGGAISTPGISYVDFLIPGILVQSLAFGGTVTGVGVVDDLQKGLTDRFRSLPMARSAVLAGRTVADIATNWFQLVVMLIVGYIVGFRFSTSVGDVIAGLALVTVIGFAFSWLSAVVAMGLKTVEAAQQASFIWLFPLTFVSSAFAPPDTMPEPLKTFAGDINPFTMWVDSLRHFFVGTPVDNQVWLGLVWLVAILVIFAPLAVWRYRRVATK
jgi:ABC transporter DrrB family efflux protein